MIQSSSVKIETFGKYGFQYIIGELLGLLHTDLFAHILEEAWHPDVLSGVLLTIITLLIMKNMKKRQKVRSINSKF